MTDLLNTLDLSALKKIFVYDPASPMLFNTSSFLICFLVFMIVYEALRSRNNARMLVTVLFSLFFYYKSSAECCFILLGMSFSDYLLGRLLERTSHDAARRLIVGLDIAVVLGLLVYFKYFNLLLETWSSMRGSHFDPLDIILPAGISFFTFRSISYMVDIYRRQIPAEHNLLNYVFFLTFFPPLLAGPVVRAKDFLPQIKDNHGADTRMAGEGLFLIMTGLIKKVVIADYLSGNFVNRIFDNPALYSGFENVMGCVGFTIQLYCDFSGYSDMAIGIALLMGYRFKENFNAPFKARNPQEFWHRWHISLSTWLRDYIYIPLGGSRCGTTRTYLNNFLTMLIGGLWHGASWMYLLWGAYHGLLLAIHKASKKWLRIAPRLADHPVVVCCNVAVTFSLVVVGFAIFRAESTDTLMAMGRQIVNDFHLSVAPSFIESYMLIVAAMCGALMLHYSPRKWTTGLCETYAGTSIAVQGFMLAIVIFLVMQAASSDLVPFIYLQY